MNTIASLSFLDRLAGATGQALLHSFWQGAAIAFLAAGLLTMIDRRRAQARYLICCSALLLLTLWIGSTGVSLWQGAGEDSLTLQRSAIEKATSGSLDPDTPAANSVLVLNSQTADRASPVPFTWAFFAALIWSTGAAFSVIRLFLQWRSLRHLRLASVPVSDPVMLRTFAVVRDRLGIREKVALRVSDRIDVPLLAGFLWPVVIMPAALIHGIPAPYLQAILAHELVHFRRWDYPINLLQRFLAALLFYHPAVWWLSRQIRIERERACDDAVVALPGNGLREYAETLAWLEQHRSGDSRAQPGPSLAISGGRQETVARLRRLVAIRREDATSNRGPLRSNPEGLISVLAASAIALAFPVHSQSSSPEINRTDIDPKEDIFLRIQSGQQRVALAERLVREVPQVGNRMIRDRQLTLFKSATILERNGKLYNLLDEEPRIFEDLPNRYLLDHELNILDGHLPKRDPDGDHFTILEEYRAGTDPNDSGDHPDYLERLKFIGRHAQIYRVIFAAQPDGSRLQLNRLPSVNWERRTMIHQIGDVTRDGQLRLEKLTGQGVDVTFLETGERFTLPKKEVVEIPIWFAELQLEIEGEKPIFIKLGNPFRLSKEPERALRLSRVDEKGAEITDVASGERRLLGSLDSPGE